MTEKEDETINCAFCGKPIDCDNGTGFIFFKYKGKGCFVHPECFEKEQKEVKAEDEGKKV